MLRSESEVWLGVFLGPQRVACGLSHLLPGAFCFLGVQGLDSCSELETSREFSKLLHKVLVLL